MNAEEKKAIDWSKPIEVSDLDMVFGTRAVADLMPPHAECAAALNEMGRGGRPWREFQARWFFHGLPASTAFKAVEGVDAAKALRHLKAIQGSFEPKHQHKEAAVAYLASLWFAEPPTAGDPA
jgi:hypothetical protein